MYVFRLFVFAALMFAAFMLCTIVAFVVLCVMIASGVRVVGKLIGNQHIDRRVRISLNARVQANARLTKRFLCSAADSAANQNLNLVDRKQRCKRAVAAAVRFQNLALYDFSVFGVIDLELLGVSEVLKDFSVIISNRY